MLKVINSAIISKAFISGTCDLVTFFTREYIGRSVFVKENRTKICKNKTGNCPDYQRINWMRIGCFDWSILLHYNILDSTIYRPNNPMYLPP